MKSVKWQDYNPTSIPIPAFSNIVSVSHLSITLKFFLALTIGKFILNPVGPPSIARSVTFDIQTLIFEVGESFIE